MELAATGDSYRELRVIARNLITLARAGEPGALQAIREIADRLDGKPKQEAEVTLRNAVASELSDDDLAAIAAGAKDEEIGSDPKPDSKKMN
jgi:cytochrome c553